MHCFSSVSRLACMRTKFSGKAHLYVFGNFPILNEIPGSIKTAQMLRLLFTPKDGKLSKHASYIIDRVCARASELHWARFQDTPARFCSDDGRVLFIGDAARAFCPSLGQGAGAAIESACLASTEIAKALGAYRRHLAMPDAEVGITLISLINNPLSRALSLSLYVYIYIYMYVYVFIYIYIGSG